MRKYHAPFGGRPTEKGSIQSTSLAAHPTQCPVVELHTRREHVCHLSSDAITSHGLRFRSWDALRDGRCPVRALKGMSGAPTSCSTRSSVTEHGRAYKTRVSWSRSSRSTQSDCCNGRTQTDRNVCRWLVDHRTSDQVRGRAGEGEQVTRWSGPARYARCGTPKQDGSSAEVHSGWSLESGLRSKDSRARLEGGRWKRAARYLAGGLPYLTSGS
jgi:hypothetical protein